MKCPKCGAPIGEGDRFCRYCGADIPNARKENEVPPIDPSLYGGMPYGGFGPFSYGPQDSSRPPMRWYYFLIYFSLFASAVLNVIDALRLFTGTYYISVESGNYTASVYGQHAGLFPLDRIYAVALLLYAAFLVYTRFALAAYRRHAPMCLLFTYVVQFTVYAAYAVANIWIVQSTVSEELIYQQILLIFMELLVSALMLYLNRIYFEKRKHLFIH